MRQGRAALRHVENTARIVDEVIRISRLKLIARYRRQFTVLLIGKNNLTEQGNVIVTGNFNGVIYFQEK